jgi:hypothetical protein
MESFMPTSSHPVLALVVSLLLLPQPAFSFQSPLSDESIREAYFLGQRKDQSTALFTPYLRTFERPETGPAVAEVELYTPFVQLLELASRRNNYSAQQASLDYRSGGTDTLFVRVRIEFTPTYGTAQYLANLYQATGPPPVAPRRANFAQDFRINLIQGEHSVEPLSVEALLTNTFSYGHFPFDPDGFAAWMHGGRFGVGPSSFHSPSPFGTRFSYITGWLVWLAFDAKDLSSSDDAQIDILGPDNLHLSAKYDLGRLR